MPPPTALLNQMKNMDPVEFASAMQVIAFVRRRRGRGMPEIPTALLTVLNTMDDEQLACLERWAVNRFQKDRAAVAEAEAEQAMGETP